MCRGRNEIRYRGLWAKYRGLWKYLFFSNWHLTAGDTDRCGRAARHLYVSPYTMFGASVFIKSRAWYTAASRGSHLYFIVAVVGLINSSKKQQNSPSRCLGMFKVLFTSCLGVIVFLSIVRFFWGRVKNKVWKFILFDEHLRNVGIQIYPSCCCSLGKSSVLIHFYLQTIMLFLWGSKYVNSFLFTNYCDLELQGSNLGGPWLARQQDYFACWLLDILLRLAASDFFNLI